MKITIDEDKLQEQIPKISASPQNIGETKLTTVSSKLPVYYVIVGCGTAAVVNHTTLRQTEWGKKRIGDLPVMHIGFKDPWSEYFEHGMGQPPYLLTMPGYHKRPSQETDVFTLNPGCSSKKFAACTENEWKLLWQKYHTEDKNTSRFEHLKGWVAVIQKKAAPMSEKVNGVIENLKKNEALDLTESKIKEKLEEKFKTEEADYRLVVIVPKMEDEDECKLQLVYAKKIDICTGGGRAQIRFDNQFLDNKNANKIGKTKLFIPPDLWSEKTKHRKIVTGPEALMTATVWKATDRVYVNGGGGIGLNMVERGEGENCHVDWASRSLHASFNLPRNDTVLRHPTHHNVDTASTEILERYLKRKVNKARAVGKVVSWIIKNRPFDTKENLQTRLTSKGESLRRHESLGGSEGGVEGYSSDYLLIANSSKVLDALDPLKEFSAGERMKAGESGIREGPFLTPTNENVVLTPSDEKWRFGKGCDLDISKISEDRVTVKIKPSTRGGIGIPEIRDYFEENTPHNDKGSLLLSDEYKDKWNTIAQLNENEGGIYNRVCVATGVGANDLGEPSSVAADFDFFKLIKNSKTVALMTFDEKIRILGAAAQMHPLNLFEINTPNQVQPTGDSASRYFFTLPMSAVPPGFIFSGINIAEANSYFDKSNPNTNINTMTTLELSEWIRKEIGEFPYPALLAEAVVKHRRFNNGYENPEAVEKALLNEARLENAKGWEAAVKKLNTVYPPARDFMD